MPAQVQNALGRLTGMVKQLSLAQRTFALIAIAALLLGGVALTSWISRPTLTPLFSGLSGADASAVVDELTAAGVTYQLADGGSTVMVPASVVYEQRVRLAAAGLPADTDGAGYSLLDDMPMTASEFQQQTTYRRALEGEMSRTVSAIEGVDAATVRLAIPEETVFVETKTDPTASVFVRTRRGVQLTADQVQAITHLVSAGVDGMEPAMVAVIDASGTVLSAAGEEGALGSSGDKMTSEYEARVGGALQTMLDRLVGAGRATVTVNAQLDLTESQRTTEEFSSTDGTLPLASSTTTEEYTGTGSGTNAGVLGPDNIAVPDGGGEGTYTSTSEDVTNAVNKATEVTKSGPGALQRQSVSVLVDEQAAGGLSLPALEEAVAAAAGIDTERGDTLSVQRMAFDTTSAEAAQEALAAADAAAAAERQSELVRQGVIAGVAVLLVVIVLAVLARRSRRARREALDVGELDAARGTPVTLPPLEGLELEDEMPVLPPPPPPAEPDMSAVRRAEIAALAEEQPEQVAELLRGWMATGGRR